MTRSGQDPACEVVGESVHRESDGCAASIPVVSQHAILRGSIVALVVAAGVGAGTHYLTGTHDEDRAAPAGAVPPLRNCPQAVDERQKCIVFGSVTAYVPRGLVDPALPLVVIDPGGPGINPLAPGGSVATALVEVPNVVVPLEPWVVSPPSAACRKTLSLFMQTVRDPSGDLTSAAKYFAGDCELELAREKSFAQSDLAEFVAEADLSWPEDLVLVGVSFGAQRIASVGTSVSLRVLISPYVTGTSIAEDAQRRWQATQDAIGSKELRLAERARATLPVTMPDRSVSLTTVDLDAAAQAAAYNPDANRIWFTRGLRDLASGSVDSQAAHRIAVAADYIEGRYGRNETYPGMVGYLGNFCAQYPAESSVATSLKGSGQFLGRLLAACGEAPISESGQFVESTSADPTCIVFSTEDPISNGAEIMAAADPSTTAAVQSTAPGHANPIDLDVATKVIQRAVQQGPSPTACQ